MTPRSFSILKDGNDILPKHQGQESNMVNQWLKSRVIGSGPRVTPLASTSVAFPPPRLTAVLSQSLQNSLVPGMYSITPWIEFPC